jgi:phosphoribosyl 1,2-cyclic phosphodiesterase
MRLTVVGGCGAWPAAGQACSGYLVEQDGFRLLIDPGYAIVPRLLERIDATEVDAVLVSHSHPDHCADLHPLLRARVLREEPAPALPVHTLPGAVDRILDLGGPGTLQDAFTLVEFAAGDQFEVGPFQVQTRQLPHWVPNARIRLAADGQVLAYTGDTGPSPPSLSWPAAPTCTRDSAWPGRGCRPRHLHRRGRGRPRRPRRRPWTLTGLRAQLRSGAAGGC